jgi:Putative lumazine-binding
LGCCAKNKLQIRYIKMKTIHYAVLILAICLGFNIKAQTQDKDLIQQSIETYFDGWMTGDTLKLGKVMHASCHLKFMKDNELQVLNKNTYLSRFKLRTKLENAEGRIVAIDITRNIASAKCEIETPERLFTDYFNMMKINEAWYIVDKISSSIDKVKK